MRHLMSLNFEEIIAPVGAVQEVLGAVGMTPSWPYHELCDMQAMDPVISKVLAQFPERPLAYRVMEISS